MFGNIERHGASKLNKGKTCLEGLIEDKGWEIKPTKTIK